MASPLILGVDFTSAPSKRKPITAAIGRFARSRALEIGDIEPIESLEAYECFLENLPRPWIGGFDHPFGQPVALLDLLGLPHHWADYVDIVGDWGRDHFTDRIKNLQNEQSEGAPREWHRICDGLARASAPHKYVNPPVGWMFVEGASRLLKAKVTVRPLHEDGPERIALEAYPKLIARRFADSYKNDTRTKQTLTHTDSRGTIVSALASSHLVESFGFAVRLSPELQCKAISEPAGDNLDAILCAIQAGWAWSMRKSRRAPYGIPNPRHPTIVAEGWIVDPSLLGAANLSPP